MSKGFLVLAQNSGNVDYVKQAYALALSIKHSQQEVTNISLVTNDIVPEKYKQVFDNVIPIPWSDDAADKEWKVENRWKLFHTSPYDETMVLDVDMLVLEDITSWWNYCSKYDVKFCSCVRNYKLDVITDTVHRKAFIENHLSNVYFGLHYFKKTDKALEFYKTLEFVCNNWEWCWTKFAPNEYQNWLSMDLAAAVTIEMLGIQQEALDTVSPLEFIHMKVPLQGWPKPASSWQDSVAWVLNSRGELIVGNIKQSRIFHYVEDYFLTDKLLSILEELNGSKES